MHKVLSNLVLVPAAAMEPREGICSTVVFKHLLEWSTVGGMSVLLLQGGRKYEGELQRMARNLTVAIAPDDFKPANELEPAVSPFNPVMQWHSPLPGISAEEDSSARWHHGKDILGWYQTR